LFERIIRKKIQPDSIESILFLWNERNSKKFNLNSNDMNKYEIFRKIRILRLKIMKEIERQGFVPVGL